MQYRIIISQFIWQVLIQWIIIFFLNSCFITQNRHLWMGYCIWIIYKSSQEGKKNAHLKVLIVNGGIALVGVVGCDTLWLRFGISSRLLWLLVWWCFGCCRGRGSWLQAGAGDGGGQDCHRQGGLTLQRVHPGHLKQILQMVLFIQFKLTMKCVEELM